MTLLVFKALRSLQQENYRAFMETVDFRDPALDRFAANRMGAHNVLREIMDFDTLKAHLDEFVIWDKE